MRRWPPMWARIFLPVIVQIVGVWVSWQERRILATGVPLDETELADAAVARVKDPARVRLLRIRAVPLPSRSTVGLTARYGIFIRTDYWGDRRLLAHELAHVAQYERAGGIRPFLRAYLAECLDVGYPLGSLELQAAEVASRIVAGSRCA